MPDLDFFNFFRYLLGTIATVYATVITIQSLHGWYIFLSGSDKYISIVRRYVIVQGLRLRFKAFWGDVVICVLLCFVFAILFYAHILLNDLGAGGQLNMATDSSNPGQQKLLPGSDAAAGNSTSIAVTPAAAPTRQLADLPKDELETLAEEYGLNPRRFASRQALVAALHERRQLIAALDRDALLDVVRWGRRPVSSRAANEQLALEIVRLKSMNFAGLSQRGLVALSRLRGIAANDTDAVPLLVRKLKKQEGFFASLSRKRRAMLGSIVANMIGESESSQDYRFLPPSPDDPSASAPSPGAGSLKEDIEEAGLFGGIAGRIKKSADSYLNQKLDEIEARIDRKLDEIDRRLAEWRDKEIANRIRILKITLWASVIVGAFSLIYSYVKVYFFPSPLPPTPTQIVQPHSTK